MHIRINNSSSTRLSPVAKAVRQVLPGNELNMPFNDLNKAQRSKLMRNAAKAALMRDGYTLEKMKTGKRGNRQVLLATRDGEQVVVAVRSSQDGWIGYPTRGQPTFGKSMAGLDLVLVVVPDNIDAPDKLQVYAVDPSDLEARFKANFDAHDAANRIPKHPVMWVSLRASERQGPSGVGAGVVEGKLPLAEFSIDDQEIRQDIDLDGPEGDQNPPAVDTQPTTVPEVMQQAKAHIARITGAPVETIKLELKFIEM